MYIQICLSIDVHLYIHIHTYGNVYTLITTHVYRYIQICTCVRVYTYMYISIQYVDGSPSPEIYIHWYFVTLLLLHTMIVRMPTCKKS